MAYRELLTQLLTATEAATTRTGIEEVEGPRAVVTGSLAWTCEGIFVWATNVSPRGPLTASNVPGYGPGCAYVPGLTLQCAILRCTRDQAKVDWTQETYEGLRAADDLEALSQEIITRWGQGTLFVGYECAAVAIQSFSISKGGMLMGVTGNLVVSASERQVP